MSQRISHSILDPWVGPRLKSLYPLLRIPRWFPPEGIVLTGHLMAIAGAVGFAFSADHWWGGLLAAVGVVGNHTADCIDGTHARTTGQCRNGGELLDHFTDPLSFAYWLVGIGVAVASLELALVAVICLFATAVLTNIKAKLTDQFVLAKFGPTEFKALLAVAGCMITAAALAGVPRVFVAQGMLAGYALLILFGVIHLVVSLVSAVREVNGSVHQPDTSEWLSTQAK